MPSAQSAKGWALIAAAFFAVLGLAAFLFMRHQTRRSAALEAQRSQEVARLGREVELKYRNYRSLVDNVTRILTSATSTAASEHTRTLVKARQSKKEALQRANQAKARLDFTTQQAEKAEATSEADAGATAYAELSQEMRRADELVQVKSAALQDAAIRLERAEEVLDTALAKLEENRRKLQGSDATRDGLAGAQETLANAQQAAANARAQFERAQAEAKFTWKRSTDLAAKARVAHEELLARGEQHAALKALVEFAESQAKAASVAQETAPAVHAEKAKEAAGQAPAPTAAESPDDASAAKQYLANILRLVLPSQRSEVESCRDQTSVAGAELCVARAMAVVNQVRGLEMVKCDAPSGPYLSEDGRYLLIPPGRATPGEASAPRSICGRVRIRQFLAASDDSARPGAARPAPTRDTNLFGGGNRQAPFDTILLLRRDGTSLHSLDFDSNLRVSALPGFDAKRADSSGMLKDLEIGTQKYRTFLQPIRLQLGKPCGDAAASCASEARGRADLLLAGLMRETSLYQASLEISLPTYLWVVVLLGLGLLSLPLAKLWLLGEKTRFSSFDVTLLATSALLLTLLGAALILSLLAHNRLARRSDDQLESVGKELELRLNQRISTSAAVLGAFNRNEKTAPLLELLGPPAPSDAPTCARAGGSLVEHVVFDDPHQGRSVCEGVEVSVPSQKTDWKLLFVLDRDANQRVKFLSGKRGSTPVNLKHREYFRQALQKTTACLDATCAERGVPELVRSVTSGDLVLVVSEPVCAGTSPCAEDATPIGVSAIEARMDAFRSLVLPLGVEAAVVDASGRVMLHSNNDAHHEQNIFSEVNDPGELRAALATGVRGTLSLNYLGQESRLHYEPLRLPGTGWSVLTIAPTSIVDVATTDMVLAMLAGYGVVLALALLVAFALVLLRRVAAWMRGDLRGHPRDRDFGLSLRPSFARSARYGKLGSWMLRWGGGLCALSLVLALVLPPLVTLLAVMVLGVITALRVPRGRIHGAGGARRSVPPPLLHVASWRDFLPLTYLLYCAGLAEVFVMTPAVALFAGAYDHVTDTLVRAEHYHYASLLDQRGDCLRALPRAGEQGTRAPHCRDVIGSGDEDPPREDQRAAPSPSILRAGLLSPMAYLADFLPRLGPLDGEDSGRSYRRATNPAVNPTPYRFHSIRDGTTLALVETNAPASAPLLVTPLPSLVGLEYRWLNVVLLLLLSGAAVAVSYVVGFQSLRRLLFLDVVMSWNQRPVSTVDDFLRASAARTVNVVVPYPTDSVRRRLREHPLARELSPVDGPRAASPAELEDPRVLWVASDFETWPVTRETISHLERAAELPGSVVLPSASDPLTLAADDQRRAWASVLERYTTIELYEPSALPEGQTERPSTAQLTRWWLECDPRERRVLQQLALGGYATPHPENAPALKTLAMRGLLDPETMTLAHPELGELARRSVTPADEQAWQDADRGTAWTALRVPLSTGVAALLAAVTLSKPELGMASALVPTLAASLPTVLKILVQMLTPKG